MNSCYYASIEGFIRKQLSQFHTLKENKSTVGSSSSHFKQRYVRDLSLSNLKRNEPVKSFSLKTPFPQVAHITA